MIEIKEGMIKVKDNYINPNYIEAICAPRLHYRRFDDAAQQANPLKWMLEVVLLSGSSIELFYNTQEEAQKDALSIVERKKSYEEICNVRRHS